MFADHADLQPLPVERAAGFPETTEHGNGTNETLDSDPAALQLEKRGLLSGHRGTVSDGMYATPMLLLD